MRWILLILWLSVLSTGEIFAEEKPYDKVLVLSGGSLRTAAFLGAIEGAIESGYTPDLLISTCGASLATAMANAHADPQKWREAIESEAFYEYMKQVRVNQDFADAGPVLKGLLTMKGNQLYQSFVGRPDAAKIPDLYSKYAINLSTSAGPLKELDRPFNVKGIPVIVVSGRLDYDPADAGKPVNGRKLFTESYLTLPSVAPHLKNQVSGPGADYPNGYVAAGTHTYTEMNAYDAVRASMSEPSLVEQKTITIEGKPVRFTAGSINGYPIELATKLGNHVVATASGPQGDVENIVFQSAFGIPLNERYAKVQRLPIDHWIDFTTWDPVDEKGSFGPKLDVGKLQFVNDFPESHEAFKKIIRAQYEFGKAEAIKAFSTPKGSRKHLRDDLLKKAGHATLNQRIDQGGKVAHAIAAPLALIEAFRSEMVDDDSPEEEVWFPSLENHAGYMATYAALLGGTEFARRHFTNYRPATNTRQLVVQAALYLSGLRILTNAGSLGRAAVASGYRAIRKKCGSGFETISD